MSAKGVVCMHSSTQRAPTLWGRLGQDQTQGSRVPCKQVLNGGALTAAGSTAGTPSGIQVQPQLCSRSPAKAQVWADPRRNTQQEQRSLSVAPSAESLSEQQADGGLGERGTGR